MAALILTACGGESIYDKKENEPKAEQEADKENEPKDEKFETKKIKLDDEFKFEQYDVKFKQVKVYEKKDKLLADITFDWTNKIYDYDKTSFFIVSLLGVKQNDEELEEINDAWNPENKLESDVLFQNAAGGTTQVKLTYELVDDKTTLKLIITPTIDEDNPVELNIEIK